MYLYFHREKIVIIIAIFFLIFFVSLDFIIVQRIAIKYRTRIITIYHVVRSRSKLAAAVLRASQFICSARLDRRIQIKHYLPRRSVIASRSRTYARARIEFGPEKNLRETITFPRDQTVFGLSLVAKTQSHRVYDSRSYTQWPTDVLAEAPKVIT